jgi:hypothetical protein
MAGDSVDANAVSAIPPQVREVKARDTTLDFWRGLALFVLCVDHVEEMAGLQAASYFTYAPIGVTTGAELFIFISGTALGYAFQPLYERGGYTRLHARCLFRAWQLYVLNAFALIATVATVQLLTGLVGPGSDRATINLTSDLVARFATFSWNASYFDILPLYIILLTVLPPFFALARHAPWVGLGLSALVWASVQWFSANGETYPLAAGMALYYKPIAWQFLFVLGLYTGIRKRRGLAPPSLSGGWLVSAAVFLVIAGFWYKAARINAVVGFVGSQAYVPGHGVPFDLPLIDKPTLGPLRLAHFLLLALVVTKYWPGRRDLSETLAFRPVIVCGRHGLEVFLFTTVASYAAGVLVPALGGGRSMVLAMDVTALLLMVGLAYLLDWKKTIAATVARAEPATAARGAADRSTGPNPPQPDGALRPWKSGASGTGT